MHARTKAVTAWLFRKKTIALIAALAPLIAAVMVALSAPTEYRLKVTVTPATTDVAARPVPEVSPDAPSVSSQASPPGSAPRAAVGQRKKSLSDVAAAPVAALPPHPSTGALRASSAAGPAVTLIVHGQLTDAAADRSLWLGTEVDGAFRPQFELTDRPAGQDFHYTLTVPRSTGEAVLVSVGAHSRRLFEERVSNGQAHQGFALTTLRDVRVISRAPFPSTSDPE
jgi:hypothetical protein